MPIALGVALICNLIAMLILKPWRLFAVFVPTLIVLFVAGCLFRDRLVAWRIL